MASPISIGDTARDVERLVSAANIRDLTDEEIANFALALGKLVLLSPNYPAAVAVLERENVTHAIWELAHQLSTSD